ncbi:MAG: 2-oxoacid:acceptor oxidoreductase family protein [Firmicutes bacterium]|nr:2-oxoacid:acceptor oxidoreductase family protein [Bacillota bacterium]
MTSERDAVRIRLTGRGGQGIMLAGAILAEAAMRDERYVTETQEYGPEARLGATKADLVVANRPIAFPDVVRPDLLLCLSRPGYLKYGRGVAPGGLMVVDDRIAVEEDTTAEGAAVVRLPLRRTARELGDEIATNIVGLGALAALSDVVSEQALAAAVAARTKPEFADLNARAVAAGLALGREARRGGRSAAAS